MNAESLAALQLISSFIPLSGLREKTRARLAQKSVLSQAEKGDFLQLDGIANEASFVVSGRVLIEDANGTESTIVGGTPASFHRLPEYKSALCLSSVQILSVDAQLLDTLLTWEQTIDPAQETAEFVDNEDWMTRLLQMPIFQSVPASNIQAMFMRMSEIKVKAGQVIIRQGDEGDYFYLLINGRCAVTCQQADHPPTKLAELVSGSSFGEEALLSNTVRNATLTMLSNGRLARLAKDDFRRLLKEPLIQRLTLQKAEARVREGDALWLDVRLPSEYQAHHLPDSINIPLLALRARAETLDKQKSYIVCCDTGRRSSVGVFVLAQRGLNAYLLDKGLPRN